jgi:glycosyltransferase involved in cell wall biosynthesis
LAQLGHHVWVITRANNAESIKRAQPQLPPNLHFVYYDLPAVLKRWKKGMHGVHLYYALWQLGAYFTARRLTSEIHFDIVHHITFGVFRQPSLMPFLPIPCILGPLGGGERAPYALRKSYPIRGVISDLARDLANFLCKFDPLLYISFKRAQTILCKTPETLAAIPSRFHTKCRVQLEIGNDDTISAVSLSNATQFCKGLRIAFVGRLIYWKGAHLAIKAFAKANNQNLDLSFTIIGSGPDEEYLHKIARDSGVEDTIEWVPWLPREELIARYAKFDVLLFPSLHDSSGNVVLEAMANALPIICLDVGGPDVLVDEHCGIKVQTNGNDEEAIIGDLARAIGVMAVDVEERRRYSQAALCRAQKFSWRQVVQAVYSSDELERR